MSARNLIRHSLTLAFSLTAATAALAEQPVRQGYRDSIATSSSSSAPVTGAASYRDAFARIPASSGNEFAGRAAGYRDALVRLPAQNRDVRVASVDAGAESN